jgi:drug/metabolite transporter (DMT)-like permease
VTLRQALLTLALAAVWGSSYLLIKYALEGFEPEGVVFLRAALAALVLALVVRAQGRAAWEAAADGRRRPRTALLLGLLAIAAPFTLISYGELEVPSGLTAVLIAPVPLFVAAFAPFLDRSEIIGSRQAVGLVVGLAGVALLVGVETIDSLGQFLGALGILGACASYALAGFVVRLRYRGAPAISTSFISVSAAALLTLVPAALTFTGEAPGARAVLSILALGVLHTALAFVIFYRLIGELGAGRGSLVSYLAPGVALTYGAIFLDERITAAAIAGLALILGGVGLASRRRAPSAVGPEGAGGAASRSELEPV